jgi:hypothetical protein
MRVAQQLPLQQNALRAFLEGIAGQLLQQLHALVGPVQVPEDERLALARRGGLIRTAHLAQPFERLVEAALAFGHARHVHVDQVQIVPGGGPRRMRCSARGTCAPRQSARLPAPDTPSAKSESGFCGARRSSILELPLRLFEPVGADQDARIDQARVDRLRMALQKLRQNGGGLGMRGPSRGLSPYPGTHPAAFARPAALDEQLRHRNDAGSESGRNARAARACATACGVVARGARAAGHDQWASNAVAGSRCT